MTHTLEPQNLPCTISFLKYDNGASVSSSNVTSHISLDKAVGTSLRIGNLIGGTLLQVNLHTAREQKQQRVQDSIRKASAQDSARLVIGASKLLAVTDTRTGQRQSVAISLDETRSYDGLARTGRIGRV